MSGQLLTIVNLFFMVSSPSGCLYHVLTDEKASHVRHISFRHDQHATGPRTILAIRNHPGRDMHTLLLSHRLPKHELRISNMGLENESSVSLATTET